MRNTEEYKDIATEAAIKILSTLVEDYDINVEKIFKFMESNNEYKKLINDDDTLVCLLHDDSIYELIDSMKERING